jgi:hypothetical protein
VTESEAKKKWCPFARVFTGTNSYCVAANRSLLPRDEGRANCIGSACMAWENTRELNPSAGGHCGLAKKGY